MQFGLVELTATAHKLDQTIARFDEIAPERLNAGDAHRLACTLRGHTRVLMAKDGLDRALVPIVQWAEQVACS